MTGPTGQPDRTSPLAPSLASLRWRIRLWLIADRAAAILGIAVATCIATGLLDYLIRMPRPMRITLWVVGVLFAIGAVRRYFLPAARFRPSLTDLALRVEQTPAGREAGLRDLLATGLEFQDATSGEPAYLRSQITASAAGLLKQLSPGAVLRPVGGAKRGLSVLLFAVVALAAIVSIAPVMTLLGAKRTLLPWTDAQWPSRTALLDATEENAHAINAALPMRVILTRTNKAPGQTRITLKYRTIEGETSSQTQTAVMTPQGAKHEQEFHGEVYERLIDPRSLASGSDATDRKLEYWFETTDSRTEPAVIRLVEPPAIVRARATVTPPAYAKAGAALEKGFVAGAVDLSPTKLETQSIAPVLQGSAVELDVRLNKAIPLPGSPSEMKAFAEKLLPGAPIPADLMIVRQEGGVRLAWTAQEAMRFGLVLEDEFGIKSADPLSLALIVAPDKAPSVAVLEPAQDETVLPSAVIDAVGEARDDVELALLTLEARTLSPRADSPGAAPEPRGQPLQIAAWKPEGDDRRTARAGATLELQSLDVKPGDEVHLYAVGQDTYSLNGQTHEPVLSSPRKLRVIGESQFIEQIVAELGSVRTAAQRLDQDQARAMKEIPSLTQTGGSEKAKRLEKEQQGLTERLQAPAALIKRLSERVDRNALADRNLRQMLEDARRLLDEASDKSKQAAAALDQAQQNDGESPADAAQAEQARENQAGVRDAMLRLASALDQGKDGWATRREVEKLLEEQRKITEQTRELAKQSGGKRLQDLTPAQRQELERVARSQQELSQRARAATDALQDRASKTKENDPAQSEAMQRAAQESSREQLEETMQQASKNAGENQTASANDYQKKAEETLQRMMEELDKASQQKNDSLRRMLANLVEQIEDLMARQSDELAKLTDASKGVEGESLDGSQIRLNQDTITVAEGARKTGPEAAPVADEVDAGAADQASAIKTLRLPPVDVATADRWQRSALDKLTEARNLARKLRDNADKQEQDRKRDELRKAYDQALQQQIALRADTSGFVGKELSRRDRAAVRSLGEKQEELRQSLTELQSKNKDLTEAGTFKFSHARLDKLMDRAGVALKEGAASKAVDSDQAASASLLRSLVDALAESKKENDFRNAQQSGSGGGGQQGGPKPLIPPIAELKLLRAMQQDAAGRTRDAAERAAPAEDLAEIGELQRELARQGQELIKKLSKQSPEKPEVPAVDTPKPDQPGEEDKPEKAGGAP